MSLANNDYNHRLVAAVDIPENTCVSIDSTGRANIATAAAQVWGVCPQIVKAGTRAPVIRGGKLGGLVGFNAGQKLYVQADGSLGTAAAGAPVAVVVSEDSSTAVLNSAMMGASLT